MYNQESTVKGFSEKTQGLSFQFWAAMTAFVLFAIFSVCSFSTDVFLAKAATAPSIITYQGKILESGAAVTSTQNMKFLIYDAANAGNLLYTASGTLIATQAISVTPSSGIFSVNLGGTGTNELDESIFAENGTIYLEVQVGGQALSPRKRFTSAPFALNSAYLMGISATTTSNTTYIPISDANGNFTFSGNPGGAGVGQGVVYINPQAAALNETLFGISSADVEKFRIDNEGDLFTDGTGRFGIVQTNSLNVTTSINVDSGTFIANGTTNRVGINTATPQYNLSVSGTSYFTNGLTTVSGNQDNVTFAGKLSDADAGVELNLPMKFEIAGNYAFVRAGIFLEVIDISNPESLQHVQALQFNGGITDLDVSGDYAYIATDELDIYDISNINSFVKINADTNIEGLTNVVVQGSYLYASSDSDKFFIFDVSNPKEITILSEITDGGNFRLDDIKDIIIDGQYAYVSEADGVQILDISKPSNPVSVAFAQHGVGGFILDAPYQMALKGDLLFVAVSASSTVQVIDISDPFDPTDAGSFTDEVGMINPLGIDVVGDRAYVGAFTSDSISVLDISDLTDIRLVDRLTDAVELDGIWHVEVRGNYVYTTVGGGDSFQSLDISGLEVSNASLGATEVERLDVKGNAQFDRAVDIRGGLRIGSNGLLLNGDLGIQAHTTTTIATNTLNFSHTALFSSAAHASSTHAFIFDTKNSLPVTSTVYLMSVRNNNTPVFSIATNGDVHASGTYYGEAIAVTAPGEPGDLAEQVDIRPEEEVEPGDVMVVDFEGDDRYTKSSQAYEKTIAGVISTKPTITLGSGKTKHTAVMALVGRVPIKVTNQNGFVRRGDLLVSSDVPGHAMKYDPTSGGAKRAAIIGTALENQNEEKPNGKIMGLVRSGWTGGSGEKNTFSGSSVLYKGKAFVEFSPEQQALIGPNDNIRVQVTLNGQANGVYVPNKWRTGFQVKESYDSGSNAAFDWQVEVIPAQNGEPVREPPDGPAPVVATPVRVEEELPPIEEQQTEPELQAEDPEPIVVENSDDVIENIVEENGEPVESTEQQEPEEELIQPQHEEEVVVEEQNEDEIVDGSDAGI